MTYPTIKLGEIIKIRKGKKVDYSEIKANYNYIDIKTLRSSVIHLYTNDLGVSCKNNDILIAWDGSKSGTVGYGLSGIIGSTLARLEITSEKILSEYLGIFLKSKYNHLNKNTSGAAIPHLRKDILIDLDLSIPPLPTQKLIVQKLDSAFKNIDESINITKNNIENIEELNKSILENIFLDNNFNKVKLEKIVDFKNGYAFKSKDFNVIRNGLQVIRIGNVLNLDKNPVYIIENEKYNSFKLLKNDLIIGLTGTRQKKDYLFPGIINDPKYYLNQRVGRIRINNDLNFKYVYFYLKTNLFRDNIFKFETGTVNQGNISGKDLINQKIPLPPLSKQKEIVLYLDEVFEKNKIIKEGYEKKLKDLEDMKQSILKEAFEGRLVND